MPISNKIKSHIEKASWIRKMFEEGNTLRQQYGAENVFDFTLGNPTMEPPEELHQELKRIADQPIPGIASLYEQRRFTTKTRTPAVAEAIAENCGLPVNGSHIVMTCGAGAALNVVLTNPYSTRATRLSFSPPTFVEYKFYIDNQGGIPVEVTTDENFQPDLEAIASAINERTRGIIINSPNNPTGVIYPQAILKQLGKLLAAKEQEFGITILAISDEPYAKISFGEEVPCIFNCISNSVIVTSHSKDLALPGESGSATSLSNPQLNDVNLFMQGAIFCNRVLGFVNATGADAKAGHSACSAPVCRSNPYRRKRDMLYNKTDRAGFRGRQNRAADSTSSPNHRWPMRWNLSGKRRKTGSCWFQAAASVPPATSVSRTASMTRYHRTQLAGLGKAGPKRSVCKPCRQEIQAGEPNSSVRFFVGGNHFAGGTDVADLTTEIKTDPLTDKVANTGDQGKNIPGAGTAEVDNKVGMLVRNLGLTGSVPP